MNSIDTKNMKEDDGGMNERVANLENIAEDTALRLGSLERITAGIAQNVTTLTQDVAALTQKVAKLELAVELIQATNVTKEEFLKGKEDFQKDLHAMTWKIIGAITLLTAAVSYLSRYNAVPYPQPAPAVSTAPAISAPAPPPRSP